MIFFFKVSVRFKNKSCQIKKNIYIKYNNFFDIFVDISPFLPGSIYRKNDRYPICRFKISFPEYRWHLYLWPWTSILVKAAEKRLCTGFFLINWMGNIYAFFCRSFGFRFLGSGDSCYHAYLDPWVHALFGIFLLWRPATSVKMNCYLGKLNRFFVWISGVARNFRG